MIIKTPIDKATNKENLEEASVLITDSDIVFVNGSKDDVLGRLHMKINKIKEKVKQLFKHD